MTLEFATREAQRRTKVLGTAHFVYQSLFEIDEYFVTSREIVRVQPPVYTIFADGSELAGEIARK